MPRHVASSKLLRGLSGSWTVEAEEQTTTTKPLSRWNQFNFFLQVSSKIWWGKPLFSVQIIFSEQF
jgi:hypothetical protein